MTLPPYHIKIYWEDGHSTVQSHTSNPVSLHGAPMVSRNPRVIKRIEIHDPLGAIETVWDASWAGLQEEGKAP